MIYLDYAAAAPVDKDVAKNMAETSVNFFGNPSSFNLEGRKAKEILDASRTQVARFLKVKTEEIIFTSSGSEANNLAVLGLPLKSKTNKRNEILISPIEHPSILNSARKAEKLGYKPRYLRVDKNGFIDLNDLKNKINKKTLFVSIIYANNEIGTIQPISGISRIIKEFRFKNRTDFPLFHTDACQATGYLNMNVGTLGIDMATLNSSKIGGPKGVGVLFLKKNINLNPIIHGGEQEFGLRAGTENLPAIVGFCEALKKINIKNNGQVFLLRNYFIKELLNFFNEVKLNGPQGNYRLSNNINISFGGLTSETILAELDKYGISAGSGSACTSRSVEPSHVLRAIGTKGEYLNGAIRFSIGKETTKKEIDYTIKVLKKIIPELRKRYKNLG